MDITTDHDKGQGFKDLDMTREQKQPERKPCPRGGCNGTGQPGGRCDRCGTAVDFPYSGKGNW